MAQFNHHSTSSVSLVVYEYRELELLEIPSEPWQRLTVFQWPSTLLANQVTALSLYNGSTFTNFGHLTFGRPPGSGAGSLQWMFHDDFAGAGFACLGGSQV
jgi:hypothetical protein